MIKIYPWDWMEEEPNVEVVPLSRTRIYPGAWVRLLADKTMMALLWHMFPNGENLLPTFLDRPPQGDMVAKPRRGWDGEHVFLPGQAIGAVPEDEVGPLPVELLERLKAVTGDGHVVTLLAEHEAQGVPE